MLRLLKKINYQKKLYVTVCQLIKKSIRTFMPFIKRVSLCQQIGNADWERDWERVCSHEDFSNNKMLVDGSSRIMARYLSFKSVTDDNNLYN